MLRTQQLPEQAIRQANEFIELGKKESALDVLYEVLKIKRGKSWTASYENVINNFLSLCLSLRNFMSAKEGLYQYRLISQNTNIGSFESVVSKFINSSYEATDKAKEQSREKVIAEDLDELETPETILLKSISETSQQDRSDRSILSPTVRFMWESLRNVLELCRNNKNMEKLYLETFKKTLKFLFEYERKTEFKKLCDITRLHLQQMFKFSESHYIINLTEPASFDIQMDVRLAQLDTAISLELWIEAFKTMEDIHMLLRNYRKAPHPKILAIFYQKISLVFSKVNVPLFHAVALQKLFVLIQEYKKGFKPEELERISTRALAATISVPLSQDFDTVDSLLFRYSERISYLLQLSSILGLTVVPNRASLVDDVVKRSILQYSNPAVVNIFKALQNFESYPNLCDYVNKQLLAIPENLLEDVKGYLPQIRSISFCIFLRRISLFYKSIHLDRLVSFSTYYNKQEVLDILLECSRTNFVKFSIDGESEYVLFKSYTSAKTYQLFSTSERDSFIHLYSNSLSYTIANISQSLDFASTEVRSKCLTMFVSEYAQKHIDFKDINSHLYYEDIQKKINVYREELSIETERLQKIQKEKMDEENKKMTRLQEEALSQEREQRKNEQTKNKIEGQTQVTRQQVEELANKDGAKKLLKDITLEDLERDPDRYANLHKELREKEINSHARRMKRVDELLDVFLLVIRKKERKALTPWLENCARVREEQWIKRKANMIEVINRNNKINNERRSRLLTTKEDLKVFSEMAKKEAEKSHQILLQEYAAFIQTEKTRLLAERRLARIKERKDKRVAELKEKHSKPVQSKILQNDSTKNTATTSTNKNVYKAKESGKKYF